MAFEQIGVEAIIDGVAGFRSDAEEVNASITGFGSSIDAAAGAFTGGGAIITGALMEIGSIAVESMLSAGAAVVGFLTDSFSGALEAETNMARLEAQIAATGGASGITATEAEALADEFKHLAGGSDDAVIAAQAVLLKFTQIGEDTFPTALGVSADLAALMGVDMSQAAQTLGFALDNPGEALARLNKQTGAFTDEEIEAIKAMAEAGDTAGAQALILSNLDAAIGGTAEILAATTEGQWKIFTETIADAGETVMAGLLPALSALFDGVITPAIPLIEGFGVMVGEVFTAFSSYIGIVLTDGDTLNDFLSHLPEGLQPFALALGDLITWVQDNLPLMQVTWTMVWGDIQAILLDFGAFVTDVLMPAIATIWEQTGIQLPTAQQVFESVMAAIRDTMQVVSDFIYFVVIPALTAAVEWTVTNWPTIQATIETVMAAVQTVINTVVTAVTAFWQENGAAIVANTQATFTTIQTVITTVLTFIQDFWNAHGETIMALVSLYFTNAYTTISTVINTIWTIIQTTLTAISDFWTAHGDTIMAIVNTVMTTINAVITTILSAVQAFWTAHGDSIMAIVNTYFTNISATITTIINVISAVISTTLALIQAVWDMWGSTILSMATTTWTAIQTIINNVITIIGAIIDAFAAALTGDWTAFGESLRVIWDTAWNTIVTLTSTLTNNALTILRTMATNAAAAFTSINWVEIGTGIINGIIAGINNLVGSLAATAANAAAAALNAAMAAIGMGSPATAFIAIGESMMTGLTGGINDKTDDVAWSVAEAARAALDAAEDALGIASPSKKAIRLIGEPFALGIAKGILNRVGEIRAAGLKAGAAALTSASTMVGGDVIRNSTITNQFNYAPTYGSAPVSPERDFLVMQLTTP